MFYCGIDIAKYKHEASVIDMSGKALSNSISFANDRQGCEKVLAIFEKSEITPDNVVIGMEATGHYWLSVYTFFLELGYTVKVINPIQSEAFRKMYIRKCTSVKLKMTQKIPISSLRSCVLENTLQLHFLRTTSLH